MTFNNRAITLPMIPLLHSPALSTPQFISEHEDPGDTPDSPAPHIAHSVSQMEEQ